ncbi:metal-sensing transcriptional repressor [Salmonella enterica subsp. enterica serovar Cerro]|nr:metal-sensing transcriptional repressor [Salmonella enterica subsp. enterica serovar Cerro]
MQGQVIALKKMLDEPHECAAVLQQIAAIRGAVNGLMREVIKDPEKHHPAMTEQPLASHR